jgi:hypothetical protein
LAAGLALNRLRFGLMGDHQDVAAVRVLERNVADSVPLAVRGDDAGATLD